VPVEASIKRGRQLTRRTNIRVAIQNMRDFVRVLAMDTVQRQTRKPRGIF
jgi:hypothetical protein